MSSRVTLPTSSGCSTPIWARAFLQSSSSSPPWMTYPHMQTILSAIVNLQANPLPIFTRGRRGRKHGISAVFCTGLSEGGMRGVEGSEYPVHLGVRHAELAELVRQGGDVRGGYRAEAAV